jgi:hypothetical protein
MRIFTLPALRAEDYPTEQSWISKLFVQLSPFIQAVGSIINGGIDFQTNIASVTKVYTFDIIGAVIPFSFLWTFKTIPNDVRVLQTLRGTSQTPTLLFPVWSYNQDTGSITISNLFEVLSSGIAAPSGTYQFTVRATV